MGRIVGEFGLKGAVKVELATDFPERFDVGNTLYLHGVPHKVERTTWHRGQARVKLEGVDNVEEAQALKWHELHALAGDRPPLEDGEYYTPDLIGLVIVDEAGGPLGTIEDVFHAPAHDVIQAGELMIPAVAEFVREVDLDRGVVVVRLIPGMAAGEGQSDVS